MSKIYVGRRIRMDGREFPNVVVEVHETHPENETTTKDLDPRNDIMNHSPGGFEWGYGGSGPAQLALAILADFTGRNPTPMEYQTFKERYIQKLDGDFWEMHQQQVENFLKNLEASNEAG